MKKFILICGLSVFFLSNVLADNVVVWNYPAQLSTQDSNTLQFLKCKPVNFSFKKGRLILGNSCRAQKAKQLFLVKNIDAKPIVLDFPEGHIGASAGITQFIESGAWQGYLYVRGKDTLPTENAKGIRINKRIKWQCANGITYKPYKTCKKHLFICEVPYDTRQFEASNSIVHQKILSILQKTNKSWWISDPQKTIVDVFLKGF